MGPGHLLRQISLYGSGIKSLPCRTLAPERGCDSSHLPLRVVRILSGAFLFHRMQFPVKKKSHSASGSQTLLFLPAADGQPVLILLTGGQGGLSEPLSAQQILPQHITLI